MTACAWCGGTDSTHWMRKQQFSFCTSECDDKFTAWWYLTMAARHGWGYFLRGAA